ncbi:hypothetical protein SALBM217S_06367 [Streptomyces griseoloalbus]
MGQLNRGRGSSRPSGCRAYSTVGEVISTGAARPPARAVVGDTGTACACPAPEAAAAITAAVLARTFLRLITTPPRTVGIESFHMR